MKAREEHSAELRLLIYKYAKGQLTPPEKEKLDAFMNRSPLNAELVRLMTAPDGGAGFMKRYALRKVEGNTLKFQTMLHRMKHKEERYNPRSLTATAIVMLLLLVSVIFLIWYFSSMKQRVLPKTKVRSTSYNYSAYIASNNGYAIM